MASVNTVSIDGSGVCYIVAGMSAGDYRRPQCSERQAFTMQASVGHSLVVGQRNGCRVSGFFLYYLLDGNGGCGDFH